jgi:YD repeat-containing protein
MRYDDGNNTIATIDTLGMITRTYYDGDNRPVTVVQNLTGQTIDDPNPPARNPSTPDQNIRTDTYYDANGNAVASQDPTARLPGHTTTRQPPQSSSRIAGMIMSNASGLRTRSRPERPYRVWFDDDGIR